MAFLKALTDGLNYEEIAIDGYQPSYLDKSIVSLHFYHNLVFIYKGKNEEGSNVVHENIYIDAKQSCFGSRMRGGSMTETLVEDKVTE